jgi:NAD(P) transhydrogenase subunit beta
MNPVIVHVAYILASVLFIFGLKQLQRVRTARTGNSIASLAMLIAIVVTLLVMGTIDVPLLVAALVVGGAVGAFSARLVHMTDMPQMVAIFNGFGGGASALVGLAYIYAPNMLRELDGATLAAVPELGGGDTATSLMLSLIIGGVTLSGSVVAFAKLQELISGQPILFRGQNALNLVLALAMIGLAAFGAFFATGAEQVPLLAVGVTLFALVMGILLVIPIGGADMPVVISLLNSYSGLAACATGFVLQNNLLIISGSLVGASGLILTNIMCKAMNRSLANVLFGGFGAVPTGTGGGKDEYTNVKSSDAEEAAMIMETAELVIVVPGYGLAVAQAQHICKELGDALEKNGTRVLYAIHPVAGRMPGHMNVLLAEAQVPYEKLMEMDDINPEFKNADVALIVGANDVVNPAAIKDPESPIAGMPILNVHESRSVMMIKRSLSPGFAKIKNELFEYPNTMMLFGDARKMLQNIKQEVMELQK